MSKRHLHYKMIVAWAEGKKIQYLTPEGVWVDTERGFCPQWYTDTQYRIKPREFEDGAWYPVITTDQRKVVCKYIKSSEPYKNHFVSEDTFIYEGDIDKSNRWVGEKIEVTWRDD